MIVWFWFKIACTAWIGTFIVTFAVRSFAGPLLALENRGARRQENGLEYDKLERVADGCTILSFAVPVFLIGVGLPALFFALMFADAARLSLAAVPERWDWIWWLIAAAASFVTSLPAFGLTNDKETPGAYGQHAGPLLKRLGVLVILGSPTVVIVMAWLEKKAPGFIAKMAGWLAV